MSANITYNVMSISFFVKETFLPVSSLLPLGDIVRNIMREFGPTISFSLKPFYKIGKRGKRKYCVYRRIPAGSRVKIDIVCWGKNVFDLLFDLTTYLINNNKLEIVFRDSLGNKRKTTLLITQISMNELKPRIILSNRYLVKFRTPTILLKAGGEKSIFPDVGVLMSNMGDISNGVKITTEDLSHIWVSAYKLRTVRVYDLMGNYQLGFIGWCVIRSDREDVSKKLGFLLSLASCTNIGYGRDFGLGVIEVSSWEK